MSKPRKIKIMDNYFHGIGSLLAEKTGYHQTYVLDVLKGKHEERDTKATREIKAAADRLLKLLEVKEPAEIA